jgi:DNA-directed RNA polymerase specialized sigma24 family protein
LLGRELFRDQAEIITLVGLYDFSHDEVAEMLRCSRTKTAASQTRS